MVISLNDTSRVPLYTVLRLRNCCSKRHIWIPAELWRWELFDVCVCARTLWLIVVLGPSLRAWTSLYIITENIGQGTLALSQGRWTWLNSGSRRPLSHAVFARWVRAHARPDAALCRPFRLRPFLWNFHVEGCERTFSSVSCVNVCL
jgi:hypothetical protein